MLIICSAVIRQSGVWSQVIMAGMAAAGSMLLTFLFTKWDGISPARVGVVPGSYTVSRIILGFAIGTLLGVLQPLLVLLSGHITLVYAWREGTAGIFVTLLLYFMLALREEISFRGYPLQRLSSSIGSVWAQVIIALIFSLEHKAGGMTLLQSLWGPGIGALLFGIVAIRTRGIALPLGIHVAWNFTQWSLGVKNDTGIYKMIIEKGYESYVDHAAIISYLAVMGLAIISFYLLPKRSKLV